MTSKGWSFILIRTPEVVYQRKFIASWISRPELALVIRPKVADDADVLGAPSVTWLKALKNSPRNCSRMASRITTSFIREKSVRLVAGPLIMFRPTVPYNPFGSELGF